MLNVINGSSCQPELRLLPETIVFNILSDCITLSSGVAISESVALRSAKSQIGTKTTQNLYE